MPTKELLPAGFPAELGRWFQAMLLNEEGRNGKASEPSLGKTAISDIGILSRGKPGPFRGLRKHPVLPTRLAIVFSGGHAEVIGRMELDSVHSGQLHLRTVGFCL